MSLRTVTFVALGTALGLTLTGCQTTSPTASSLLGLTPHAEATKSAANAKTAAGLPQPTDLESAVKLAQMQRNAGDLKGAVRTLGQLVLFAPDNPRVLGEYGKTLAALGRADDAVAFLQRALQLQPKEWSLYSALGVAYDQKGDYRAAKLCYERALTLKPGDSTVLSNAALSRMLAGDLAGAEEMLLQASQQGQDPKIAANLALVRSLKGPASASLVKQQVIAKADAAPAASAPASAPALQPSLPAKAQPSAKAAETAPTAVVAAAAPAANTAPAPVVAVSETPKRTAHRTLEELRNDPTVRIQALPDGNQKQAKVATATPQRIVPAKAVPPRKPALQPASEKKAPAASALEALRNDPTVRLGPIPQDNGIRKRTPRKITAANDVETTSASPAVVRIALRPTVTEVTAVAATVHRNVPPLASLLPRLAANTETDSD